MSGVLQATASYNISSSGPVPPIIIGYTSRFIASASTVTTNAMTTTGASLIVIGISHVGNVYTQNVTISDNKGNTYTLLRKDTNSASSVDWYYANAPISGTGHTFTVVTGPPQNLLPTIYVIALSGTDHTIPITISNAQVGGAPFLTSIGTGGITPVVDNSLILSLLNNYNNSTTVSVNSGMTILDQYPNVNPTYGSAFAYKLQTVATAINPTWRWSFANSWNIGSIIAINPQISTFATWNPSDKGTRITLSGGNLTELTTSSGTGEVRATIPVAIGQKRYWECKVNTATTDLCIGVDNGLGDVNQFTGENNQTWSYYGGGGTLHNHIQTGTQAAYANGDVIGLALDLVAFTLQFYKNGVATGSALSLPSSAYYPAAGSGLGPWGCTARFNPASMTYAAPAGFTAGVF